MVAMTMNTAQMTSSTATTGRANLNHLLKGMPAMPREAQRVPWVGMMALVKPSPKWKASTAV